jgi:hypothetical protein
MRIGIKNHRLSLPTKTGQWRVPASAKCELSKIKIKDEDRGFTETKQDAIFKKIDNRRKKFKNSYKYGKEK